MTDPFEGIDDVQAPAPKTKKGKKIKTQSTKLQNKMEKQLIDDYQATMQPVTMQPEKDPDDVKERATLIYAIRAYGKSPRFKQYLKQQGKISSESKLQKMTVEQLKLELESLDLTICDRGQSDFIDTLAKNGMTFVETIMNDRTKMKVSGTTEELWKNERFLDLLERVKLKYSLPSVKLDPGIELMFVTIQTAMLVHNQNQFRNGLTDDTLDLDAPVKKITTKDEKSRTNDAES